MINTVATATAQRTRFLPSFRRITLDEGILRSDAAIRRDKEGGYIRCYYPNSDTIEEIGPTGIKVRFVFDRAAFRALEENDPTRAAMFMRYNADLFGSMSCGIDYMVKMYGRTHEQVRKEINETEREVLRIVGIDQARR